MPFLDLVTISVRTPFSIGRVNCYLLVGEPLSLVDTGPLYPEALTDIEEGFARAGRRVDELELVLLTHQHADHVGLAGLLKERSGCVIAAHESLLPILVDAGCNAKAEGEYQASILRVHGAPERLIAELADLERPYHRFNGSVELDRPLQHGETINAGGQSLTTRLRPGHSPTDTIFVESALGHAFVGDHLIERFASNPLIHRPLGAPPDPYKRVSTLARYQESLRETAADGVAVLYPGHGEPVTGVPELIASRFALQAERMNRVMSEIRANGTTAFEITRAIWPEGAVSRVYLALCEVLGSLDLLEADGRVRRRRRGLLIEYLGV